MKSFPVYVLSLLFFVTPGSSEELLLTPEEFPRVAPTEPSDAIISFEVEKGFEVMTVAHEPAIMDPIAMAFDEKGRAYVLEMRGYSERRDEALGRVRLLTDTNGDGVFDQSSIFKDGLKWPTAILCYRGGVFVGATPDVFYFRDNDGDGISDEDRHLFTGFGIGKPELNMQALFNSFRWGPDNRVWGATAPNGGSVTRPDTPEFGPVSLRGADFSFDPEALDLRPENGTAQYGLSFDSKGRRFVCSNSRHLIHVAYERQHLRANPLYPPPPALVDIPDDGAAAPVFRISPDEPWRIIRTRWRVAGVVPGQVEGGGRVSGYFTSASGVHLYWGRTFGKGFRNNAFIGDVGSNLVHRKLIEPSRDSWSLVGRRASSNEKTEFLRSRDNWFRPTSFATGPDGCLYLTDMYRETIEHPWSLPGPIKDHLDLNSGFDRGRIYRISPLGFTPPEQVDLGTLSDDELKGFLREPDSSQWHETTARRLLYERGVGIPKPTAHPFPAILDTESLTITPDEAAQDIWKQFAYLNALRSPESLRKAWESASTSRSLIAAEIATMVGRSRDSHLILLVSNDLVSKSPSDWTARSLAGLAKGVRAGIEKSKKESLIAEGFSATDFSYTKFKELPIWAPMAEQCREILENEETNEHKEAAISLLSLIGGEGSESFLADLLIADATDESLKELLAGSVTDPDTIANAFPKLPANARAASADKLLKSVSASEILLDLLGSGKLPLSRIPAAIIDGLRTHGNKSISTKAAEILPPVISRTDVIEKYRPAIEMAGDPRAGRQIFSQACQSCHLSHEGEGIDLGPSLTSFGTAGRASLLERILDPNREVAPQYEAYLFTLPEGKTLSGMIRSETTDSINLRLPGGLDETFLRSEVTSMKAIGQSLMPEGIENTVTISEMADLLSYLETAPLKD